MLKPYYVFTVQPCKAPVSFVMLLLTEITLLGLTKLKSFYKVTIQFKSVVQLTAFQ